MRWDGELASGSFVLGQSLRSALQLRALSSPRGRKGHLRPQAVGRTQGSSVGSLHRHPHPPHPPASHAPLPSLAKLFVNPDGIFCV